MKNKKIVNIKIAFGKLLCIEASELPESSLYIILFFFIAMALILGIGIYYCDFDLGLLTEIIHFRESLLSSLK